MEEATRRGKLRQGLAETRNLKPVLSGSEEQHTRGCYLETAIAKYLGEEVPEDWTLEGDRARGCDIGTGWHARGSWYGDWFLWRPWDKQAGTWIFGRTRYAPRIQLAGWLSGEECASVAVRRPGKAYLWIPVRALNQLPGWLYGDPEPACVRALHAA